MLVRLDGLKLKANQSFVHSQAFWLDWCGAPVYSCMRNKELFNQNEVSVTQILIHLSFAGQVAGSHMLASLIPSATFLGLSRLCSRTWLDTAVTLLTVPCMPPTTEFAASAAPMRG